MRLNEFASGDKVVTEGIVDDIPADNMINTMNSLRKDSDRNRYAHLQNLLKRAKKPETIEKIKALLAIEFPQGVTEDTQSEDVDQITRDFVQHYENDPMGVFMHAKSSYLDAVGKAKHFSRKAAALYKSHANMSKQEFQDTVMKYFGKHLQNNGFPPHASEGWGKAEHELVKELINLDNQGVAEDKLDEVSSNWEERIKAQERIADLIQSTENWEDHHIDDINEMKKLVKIVGRATVIRDSDNYRKLGTAGKLLDLMTHYYNQKQLRSGTLPQFTSAVASSQYFARQIAMHTNGTYDHRYARVWTTSHGQRYKDPSDYVEYNSKDDLNSAWQWIESKGKKVYYYDHFKHLNTAVKIGKFIVEPASYTTRAFSDSPETVHAVSVRSAAVINKSVRRQVDISDQQANALKDIAATKNKNALEGIKLIMSILQGEQDVKSVIDNSKKLDSNVKAKLDAIIAGAANFKEPDQGVTEGEVIKPDFSKRFKPTIGSTVTKSPYYKNPDIDVPAFDKRRKLVWRDGVSNPKDREEFHHFEVDSSGRSYQITGITKSGERIQISTTPLKELAEVLANAYNRGGFTDVDIERVPLK